MPESPIATPIATPIDQLLRSRPDLWRGQQRPARQVIATGRATLDAWLPDGGWPHGRLIELLPEPLGSGELELLLPMLAEQTRQGRPTILAAPPLIPCPQHLEQAGLALERLIIVRSSDQAPWAAEQSLKSGLCGAVVLWPPPGRIEARTVRRLQLAAESGSAPLFVCYRPGQEPPPSLATLRLGIRPGPELTLLRGSSQKHRLHLGRGNVVTMKPRSAQTQ